jgi:hypothetical protein
MRFFDHRRADSIVPDQGDQSSQRLVKLMRISKRGFEQSKLLRRRPTRFRTEGDGNDRMFGFEILQVRLEHPEEKIDVVGRLRDFEDTNVCCASRTGTSQSRFVYLQSRKCNGEGQLARDEINAAKAERELLEESSENKKQRLGRLDLVIELVIFDKNFRRLNEFEHPGGGTVGPFPESDCFGAKAIAELLFIKSSQLAQSIDPPLAQDAQYLGS